jgi:hypothetical protein
MVNRKSARSGTKQAGALLSLGVVRALALSVTLPLILTACAQTRMTVTDKAAMCSAWRPITYSKKRDTGETVTQVRIHNRTYDILCKGQ